LSELPDCCVRDRERGLPKALASHHQGISMQAIRHPSRRLALAALSLGASSFSLPSYGIDKSDEEFLYQAAMGGMTEVELAKLAHSRSRNADLKAFAAQLVVDHQRADAELTSLAVAKNIRLRTDLDARHRAAKDRFEKQSGADFDRDFASYAVD